MDSIPRSQLVVYAAAALAVILIGARYLRDSSPAQPQSAGRPVPVQVSGGGAGERGTEAVVQVVGEVNRPGLFRLRRGDRIDDAVRRAGGPTSRADLAGVNLAAKIEDGQQVIVPARAAAGVNAAAADGSVPARGAPLNLNTATVEQLDALDGVGPATAQKIVAYRQAHGGFRSVSELDRVPGIGPRRLAALRSQLRV